MKKSETKVQNGKRQKQKKVGMAQQKKKWKYFSKTDDYANYAKQMTCDVILWTQSGIK